MAREHHYWMYILASQRNGTLYIGVTNDVVKRVWEHKQGAVPGFTKTYGVNKLVYTEYFEDIGAAITREKVLKRWRRAWKMKLIEGANPFWRDLYEEMTV